MKKFSSSVVLYNYVLILYSTIVHIFNIGIQFVIFYIMLIKTKNRISFRASPKLKREIN